MPVRKQSGVRKVNAVTWRLEIGLFCEGNGRLRKPQARSRVSLVFVLIYCLDEPPRVGMAVHIDTPLAWV